MNYNGEHLLPGQIGYFLTSLSLVASVLATIAFFKANYAKEDNQQKQWFTWAKLFFLVETISIVGIFIDLYFIIYNHYHEYYYAWNHSSKQLPMRYILACFWEGSEGSFLLWSFWHCVLGWIFLKYQKSFASPVMGVISFAQTCLATMVLGIFIFDKNIGTNPFILWRQQMPDIPLFSNPNYLQFPKVSEGNDLNVLLQNYWMVIHPPVLFLGFASTIIPFGYAIAGLLNKNHEWIKPALPWAVFSSAALGTGIMMGGAWAYESLSFGGYWAWDPVENASLVPWLVLIAGLHTNLIYKSTGYSLRSTYFFYLLSFLLVLYSTFLTRSGILGDTSVHAFTDLGMNVQLLLFLLVFTIPSLVLWAVRVKQIPAPQKEESNYSREFWMFIGSMIFFLAGIIIIAKTSVPIYNKLFNQNIAPPEDREFEYNRIQIFIAIVLAILTAVTQFFKYKSTNAKQFIQQLKYSTLATLVIGAVVSFFYGFSYTQKGLGFLVAIYVCFFTSLYAVIGNISYIFTVLKGKVKVAGASVTHIGFGLILIGILCSSANKNIISTNTTGIAVFKKTKTEDPAENITLFKGIKTDMRKYWITYVNDTFNTYERKRFFNICFESKDGKEKFSVYPDLAQNNKGNEGFAANPAAKHYWNKDVFVYISAFEDNNKPDTSSFTNHPMKVGDTAFYSNGFYILKNIQFNQAEVQKKYSQYDTTLTLQLQITSKEGAQYTATPTMAVSGGMIYPIADTVMAQNLVFNFNKLLNPANGQVEVGIKESKTLSNLITLKVIEFPFINILWIGVVVMVIGMIMSIYQRAKRRSSTVA